MRLGVPDITHAPIHESLKLTLRGNEWMFCPICGTPHPTEKSLAEKFKEYLSQNSYIEVADLAQIAEDHYKNK